MVPVPPTPLERGGGVLLPIRWVADEVLVSVLAFEETLVVVEGGW